LLLYATNNSAKLAIFFIFYFFACLFNISDPNYNNYNIVIAVNNNNDNNGMAITSNTPAHELTLELDSPQATSATGYLTRVAMTLLF
jgi:hypothetical protein